MLTNSFIMINSLHLMSYLKKMAQSRFTWMRNIATNPSQRGDREYLLPWPKYGIYYLMTDRLDNRNLKFFKKNSVKAQFKAINERISEWAYFLNLVNQFQLYLHFSVPKRGFLWTRVKGKLYTWSSTKNRTFDGFFCSPLGINPHNFVKNHPIFKNKGLFYAKFCRALQEIFFML